MELGIYNYVVGMSTYANPTWRCDNVGGLREHATSHMFRFLSQPFLTLFLKSRPARICGRVLTIHTSWRTST